MLLRWNLKGFPKRRAYSEKQPIWNQFAIFTCICSYSLYTNSLQILTKASNREYHRKAYFDYVVFLLLIIRGGRFL
jgi:hypothetical protein